MTPNKSALLGDWTWRKTGCWQRQKNYFTTWPKFSWKVSGRVKDNDVTVPTSKDHFCWFRLPKRDTPSSEQKVSQKAVNQEPSNLSKMADLCYSFSIKLKRCLGEWSFYVMLLRYFNRSNPRFESRWPQKLLFQQKLRRKYENSEKTKTRSMVCKGRCAPFDGLKG